MRKVYLSIFILASLSLSACNPPTVATAPQGGTNQNTVTNLVVMEGIVNDPSDQPLSNVQVTIKDNNKVLAQTMTDSKGQFSTKVPKVFGDSYLIDAKKDVTDGNLTQTILVNLGEKADFTGKNKLVKTQIASNPAPIQ